MSEQTDDDSTHDAGVSPLTRALGAADVDRRTTLGLLGMGALGAVGSGTAAAGGGRADPPDPPVIDAYYGYSAPTVPDPEPAPIRPDHTVGLHVHEESLLDRDPTTLPFHFAPMGLQIDPGDVVRFDGETPEHTVTAYHVGQGRQRRVPDAVPAFSSPVLSAGGAWYYRFDEPGTYDVFCAPHEFFGMVLRLVVGDPCDDAYDGEFGAVDPGPPPSPRPPISRPELAPLGVTSWPFPVPAEVFATDAMSVATIADEGVVTVGDVEAAL